jgi:hypothetical protein
LLAAVSGYRRGTNFGVSRTSTGYGDLQFFSWTHWSFHHCALGEEPAIAGDAPYAFIITGFPMTSYLLNSENVWRAHREPVDSRSPRLNGPGPSDSITWSLPKDSVSGGRMEQAPCLPHGLFLALLLLPLLLLCRCLFRLLHRLAKLFDRFDTRRFQAILRNIPPHRRVIQRVLQSSSLKHQEGVVFRSNFHPCMRWLWRGSLPRQIRRTPLLRTDPYLIVCCLDGSGTCIDRPAIDCRIRSLPRAFSHTSNQVPRVLIERQPISPTSGTLSLLLPGPYGSQTDHRSARPHPA